MKIGISIATYRKPDGSTKELLTRALESIKNQTHQDYKVFLIGDKYDDVDEFNEIATSIIPPEKIYYENLPYAKERDKYFGVNNMALWTSGGCNARNHANSVASNELTYVCQLDHDAYYLPNHLSNIVNAIQKYPDAAFIYTLAKHLFFDVFPHVKADGSIIEKLPEPSNVTHSSVCINNRLIPFKYRDVLEETGKIDPSDADMWRRISELSNSTGIKSYLICEVTCVNETENKLF